MSLTQDCDKDFTLCHSHCPVLWSSRRKRWSVPCQRLVLFSDQLPSHLFALVWVRR